VSDGASPQDSTQRYPILVVQLGFVDGVHGAPLICDFGTRVANPGKLKPGK